MPRHKFRITSKQLTTFLVSYLPIVSWLPRYDWRHDLRHDLVAGITVAFLVIPQGIAYAALANLPPATGLYTVVIPMSIYAIFGTSRQLSVAPVAVVSLLVANGIPETLAAPGSARYIELATIMALLVGVLSAALGLLGAGHAVSFISPVVITGFTSAAALVIASSQLEPLFGINVTAQSDYTPVFIYQLLTHLGQTQLLSFAFGALALLVLIVLGKFATMVPRALLVAVISTVCAWAILTYADGANLSVVGAVPAGLPSLRIPAITSADVGALALPASLITLIGYMESLAVGQKYAFLNNYTINASQELIALGLANIAVFFFQGFPATGGFSRTAVNAGAGAKTLLASAITVIVTILALLFLTPLLYFLPRATLAAIIITSVIPLIEVREIIHLFHASKRDFFIAVLTFGVTFGVGVEIGLGVGIGVSILLLLLQVNRPHTAILGEIPTATCTPSTASGQGVPIPLQEIHTDTSNNTTTSCGGVFRNVKRYPEAKQFDGIVILRFDASLFFVNISYFVDIVLRGVATRNAELSAAAATRHDEEDGGTHLLAPSATSATPNTTSEMSTGDLSGNTRHEAHLTQTLVRFVVVDFSSVNRIDVPGCNALAKLNGMLREMHITLLLAGVKGPVKDLIIRAGVLELSPAPDNEGAVDQHEGSASGQRGGQRAWLSWGPKGGRHRRSQGVRSVTPGLVLLRPEQMTHTVKAAVKYALNSLMD